MLPNQEGLCQVKKKKKGNAFLFFHRKDQLFFSKRPNYGPTPYLETNECGYDIKKSSAPSIHLENVCFSYITVYYIYYYKYYAH